MDNINPKALGAAFSQETHGWDLAYSKDETIVHGPHGYVAKLYPTGIEGKDFEHAHLIKSAPKLLQALEDLKDEVDEAMSMYYECGHDPHIDTEKAEAVIAEAKGK